MVLRRQQYDNVQQLQQYARKLQQWVELQRTQHRLFEFVSDERSRVGCSGRPFVGQQRHVQRELSPMCQRPMVCGWRHHMFGVHEFPVECHKLEPHGPRHHSHKLPDNHHPMQFRIYRPEQRNGNCDLCHGILFGKPIYEQWYLYGVSHRLYQSRRIDGVEPLHQNLQRGNMGFNGKRRVCLYTRRQRQQRIIWRFAHGLCRNYVRYM